MDFSGSNLGTSHPDYASFTFDDLGACSWNLQAVFSLDVSYDDSSMTCDKPGNFDVPVSSEANCEIYNAAKSACLQCKIGYFFDGTDC